MSGAPTGFLTRPAPPVAPVIDSPAQTSAVTAGGGVFANDQDIGSPAQPGSLVYSNGTYTITAGGADIGGNADQFNFAYNSLVGDGSIIADVTSLANTNASAKAGLMFRNGTGASAAFVGIFLTPASGIALVTRATDGGTAGQTTLFGITAPRFVKLTRAGNDVTAYYSANGLTWTQLGGAQTATLGAGALVGLAVTSHNIAATTTATFTNVSLLLPAGWNDFDIGAPALPGFATYDSTTNAFVVTGGGTDIGGTADQFNFASRSMTGDGSVIALVGAPTNTNPSAKSGIMIRDDATAGAMFTGLAITAQNGVVFQWRSTAGAASSATIGPNVTSPIWLELTQQGNVFSAFYSSNAINWTQLGASQTIAMSSATTLAGIVVTSHNNAALASANVGSISIVQGGWTHSEIGSPALPGSAIYDAPSDTYMLLGSGTDIAGNADRFNFASRSMSGDGTVVTYVNSISNTDPSAKAGVIVRVDSTPASAFAGVFVTPQNGLIFEWRPTPGAAVQQTITGSITAPVSLKLVRAGNNFTAYYSTDQINWVPAGAVQNVTMPSTALAGLAVSSHDSAQLCTATFTGTGIGNNLSPGDGVYSAADELFLNDLENRSILFFYNETNPNTGLVPDSSNASGGSPSPFSSIAALGFGLTALTIADQRGWLSHANAYNRALTTVNFLFNTAAQVNGFFYHFLNPATGQRYQQTELSSVDTAELMAGVLNIGQYWAGTPLQAVAQNVFNRVNWPWMQRTSGPLTGQFFGAWTPENGFSNFSYGDFSEAVVLYLMGLGSPTHPIAQSSWNSWTRTPVVHYGPYTFITAGTRALFTVQYPQAWFDMRGLTDSFGLNYYANAQTATLAQRQWMTDLSPTFPDYGPNMWGLTASDSINGYTVWGGPPAFGPIDGTVVPTGPGGSLEFVPRQSIDALKNMQQMFGSTVYKKYGFVDAFKPNGWTSSLVLGIDQGMMLLAAENSRSNFVWNVFNQSAVARQSLASAFPSITPLLVGAVSRKPASGSATPDVAVDLGGGAAIEARQGGPTQLVLTFGANVVPGPNFAVSLSRLGGGADGTVNSTSFVGSTLTINLSGTIDAQTLVVDVSDVRHFSNSAAGNYTFNLGVLLADANHDGRVNVNDFSILATNFGRTAASDMQGDFNFDGMVNVNDFGLLAGQFGKTLAVGEAGISALPRVRAPSTFASPFSQTWISNRESEDDAISGLLDGQRYL